MEDRVQKAVELFKSGYNCSQSVVAAFADMYGFTQEVKKGSFAGSKNVLFLHTGGLFGLFPARELFTGLRKG